MDVTLRPVRIDDLDVLFEHYSDPIANQMAAFGAADPQDRDTFDERWARILGDEAASSLAVLVDGEVAGYVAAFAHEGVTHVAYWIGADHWGRGIATRAVSLLGDMIAERPLSARVAHDNVGSQRVLAKCGFVVTGRDRGFANARGAEIEEFVFELR